ncbi:unnamed protein product [Cochlearia groenlandica]
MTQISNCDWASLSSSDGFYDRNCRVCAYIIALPGVTAADVVRFLAFTSSALASPSSSFLNFPPRCRPFGFQ